MTLAMHHQLSIIDVLFFILFFLFLFLIFFIFLFFNFFNKKFMPISARGTTVAQANSECTLITIRMYLSVI